MKKRNEAVGREVIDWRAAACRVFQEREQPTFEVFRRCRDRGQRPARSRSERRGDLGEERGVEMQNLGKMNSLTCRVLSELIRRGE